jgi:hypothetical protein
MENKEISFSLRGHYFCPRVLLLLAAAAVLDAAAVD